MAIAEYDRHDALGLAGLVKSGAVSAGELLEEAIARADRLNPGLNAIVCRLDDVARAAARDISTAAPFAGVPFLVKDLGPFLAGAPMTMGSRSLKDFVPDRDGEYMRRAKAAGLVIFGKTNTPEFGSVAYTEPELFGPCRNPWDRARTPGGSSGGSAAAVAAGIVPMAHGNDGGGSLRIPAGCTGLFGLKPSRGRMPYGPLGYEEAGWLAVDHVISRSVRDSAAMLDATQGRAADLVAGLPPPAEPFLTATQRDPAPLRVALLSGPMFGKTVDPECRAAVEHTGKLLAGLGHMVEEVAPPADYPAAARAFITLFVMEKMHDVDTAARVSGRHPGRGEVEALCRFAHAYGRSLRGAELAWALEEQARAARAIAAFMARYDVLLTPTLAAPPLAIGAQKPRGAEAAALEIAAGLRWPPLLRLVAGQLAAQAFDWVAFTPLFNLTGQPAMSVPLYWSAAGLPVGTQIVGRYGEEFTLFRLAAQLERAQPWFARRPPS